MHNLSRMITLTSLLLFAAHAGAQDAPRKGGISGNAGLLEEIVVTARKKTESLQETPLSITALSAEQLQQVGATSNYDVALLTPNFSTNQQLGRRLDRPVVRGQSGAAVGGEPNASYFIDGVFVSGSISSATLGPVERVEIIRGPQSALFGRATFAGAVNYITRKPTNEQEGETRVVGASNDTLQVNGWNSGAIVKDKLQYFVAGAYDTYGGEWKNSLKENQAESTGFLALAPTRGDSSTLGGTETVDLTGKLLWQATDSTEISLKLGYTEAKDDHYAQFILEPGELNCFLPTDGTNGTVDNTNEVWYNTSQGAYCGEIDFDKVTYNALNPFAGPYIPGAPQNGDSRQARFNIPDFEDGVIAVAPLGPPGANETFVAAPTRPGSDREQKRFLLQVDQGIGEWELVGRLAINQDEFRTAYDLDQRERRPLAGVFTVEQTIDVDDKSAEIILASPSQYRVRGSLGTYLFKSTNKNAQRRFTGGCQGINCPGDYFVPFINLKVSGLAQFEDPLVTKIQNRSIFGTFDVDILENLTFSAEARYAKDKKSIDSPYTCIEPGDAFFGQAVNDEIESDALTPRFILNWQATDDVMVYGLVSKGNKPAEFNSAYFRITANPCQTLVDKQDGLTQTEEERAWTYEAGTKTTWLGGRALANLSVFFIEWKNQTTFETRDINGVISQVLANAGRSEVFGLEFESSFAFTERFTGSLSYGLADGKYKNYNSELLAYTTGAGLITSGPNKGRLDPNGNNASGNAIPFSPKHSVIGSLAYNREINANLGWFARTDAIWESKRYTGAANLLLIPERTIWNGRIGLENGRFTLSTYVSNILNDQTPTAAPSFLYFSDAGLGLTWNKGGCPGGGNCRTGIETAALSPQRGRQYGIDFIVRFGNRSY